MNTKLSMMKGIMLTTALVAGVSGIVRADDSGMNPYTGDSYAYFNGGNLPQGGKPVVDKAPSAFRQTNPHGLPFRRYEELCSGATYLKPVPVFDNTIAPFRRSNPHGLPFGTYAALSSSGPEYPLPGPVVTSAHASNDAPVMTSKQHWWSR
jgi:hypothetical protein